MVMVGQEKRLREPLRWTRSGIAALAVVAALALAGAVALGLTAFGGASGGGAGCVDVTFASTLGGAKVSGCGKKARAICAGPEANPAAAAHGRLRAACAAAGLPYGHSY